MFSTYLLGTALYILLYSVHICINDKCIPMSNSNRKKLDCFYHDGSNYWWNISCCKLYI